MTDSYEVVTAALSAHAGKLSGLAGELRAAADIARGQNITTDAYGQTCQQFATMIDALANAGQETLQAGVESLEAEMSNLRTAAAAYEQRETSQVDTFGKIGSR
jgi:LPS O-antigen subunit length determinant protein (WzzB/FepE family)